MEASIELLYETSDFSIQFTCAAKLWESILRRLPEGGMRWGLEPGEGADAIVLRRILRDYAKTQDGKTRRMQWHCCQERIHPALWFWEQPKLEGQFWELTDESSSYKIPLTADGGELIRVVPPPGVLLASQSLARACHYVFVQNGNVCSASRRLYQVLERSRL